MALLMWALLACSSGYWLLKLGPASLPTPANALSAADRGAPRGDLTRLFGAAPVEAAGTAAQPNAESRFQLLGVVAPKRATAWNASEGLALMIVDGGPPRTVRVGAMLDGEFSLLAVEARSVTLGRAGVPAFAVQLAPPTVAAAGTLPLATPSPVVLGGNAVQPPTAVGNFELPPPTVQNAPGPGPNSLPTRGNLEAR